MRKYFLLLIFTLALFSCHELKNKELYEITDKYVESLYTTYDSYGMLGGDSKYTEDGEYKVHPTGRLINVRIERVASEEEYEKLKDNLLKHYKGNSRVNSVYICGGGTVMIDCRN